MQGKNASERTKAVAKVTRDAAAAARFHELISGVFDGLFGSHVDLQCGCHLPSNADEHEIEILQGHRLHWPSQRRAREGQQRTRHQYRRLVLSVTGELVKHGFTFRPRCRL